MTDKLSPPSATYREAFTHEEALAFAELWKDTPTHSPNPGGLFGKLARYILASVPSEMVPIKKYESMAALLARSVAGECLKCGIGPHRETCAYPEDCEHPGRMAALERNQALLSISAANRYSDVPGAAGKAGSHLDMAKAPGTLDQRDRFGICAAPETSPSATPCSKITSVTRAFDYNQDTKQHTPWVMVCFPPNDWEARDAFAKSIGYKEEA